MYQVMHIPLNGSDTRKMLCDPMDSEPFNLKDEIRSIRHKVNDLNIRLVKMETTMKAWLPIIAALCLAVGSIIGRVI